MAAFSTRMVAASPESMPEAPLPSAQETTPRPDIAPPPSAPMNRNATTSSPPLFGVVETGSEPIYPDAPQPTSTTQEDTASETGQFAPVAQVLGAGGPPANVSAAAFAAMVAGQDDIKLAQANVPATAVPAPARSAAKAVQAYAFPPPLHLKYTIKGDIKGLPMQLKGDLHWKQDGTNYEARLEVSHFLLGSRVQTSRGELGAQGLEPTRLGDKFRSERAAHFERSKGKITFSANTPDGALLPGTQDHLSVFFQLAAMLGGSPGSFPEGSALPFEAVGPTSVESWVFKVGALEKLVLPAGPVAAIKLTRDAVGPYGTRGEVWLAPSMDHFPVRIRLTESNGDVMDLRWSETVAP